jgi:acetate kinase
MKILVLTPGSSSLKFQLIEAASATNVERNIGRGIAGGRLKSSAEHG